MHTYRIFLADDHPIVRQGIQALINAQPDLKVVGEAGDGEAALRGVEACSPDVAVVDISMPRLNGLRATAEMKRISPGTRILVLTMLESRGYLRELMSAGASGYVLKRSASNELVHAIRVVAGGGTYLDSSLAGKVMDEALRQTGGSGEGELSDRELEVLRRIAQGYSNKEIGTQLGVSVKTVETYKARAMEKLELSSRVDIVRYALHRNWLLEP